MFVPVLSLAWFQPSGSYGPVVRRVAQVLLQLVLAAVWVPTAVATPAQRLELRESAGAIDAWPVMTALSDPSARLDLAAAQQQQDAFKPPQTPRNNLGAQPGATWLRIPVIVPVSEDRRWIMKIDSPLLEFVEVHLVGGGTARKLVTLGNAIAFAQRPFATRSHAVSLNLEPGQPYEVWLRIRATKAIVPISFHTLMNFHAGEAREQMVQGVIAGLGLCLLLYSLAQWAVLRDRMFFTYALYVAGVTILFYAYFGLAPQHLWPNNAWLSVHAPILAALASNIGIASFTEQALSVRQWSVRLSRGLVAIRVIDAVVAGAYALDWIDMSVASLLVCLVAPALMVLAITAATRAVLNGDRAARFMVCGWVVYTAGILTFIGTYQGLLAATYWTQHSLQFFSLSEMAMWMVVLGMRVEEIRKAAQQVHVERDTLHSMAHTDPLTGLPNRRGLSRVLDGGVQAAHGDGLTAVYLLDLDGFKPINDRLGHDAGDELLVGVARRLKQLVRARDTVARIGGDEFVVVATQLPNDIEARRLGQKLLDGMRAPFDVAGQSCQVGLTVGYALGPLDGTDATTLLKRADEAMYAGKQAGRHCIRRSGDAQVAACV